MCLRVNLNKRFFSPFQFLFRFCCHCLLLRLFVSICLSVIVRIERQRAIPYFCTVHVIYHHHYGATHNHFYFISSCFLSVFSLLFWAMMHHEKWI